MSDLIKSLETLVKTLEAGNYNVAPGQQVGGSALQIENLEAVMHNTTFDDSHIKLQKLFKTKKAKSLLVQFNRQLSYGHLGSSAVREGQVGDMDVGEYVRAVVPMAFYSQIRRVTVQANMIETIDGEKAEDREAKNAAMVIAGDIELHTFGGKARFSNAGIFDGNPDAMGDTPEMMGIDPQIRMSDMLVNTKDLMFSAFGSDESVVLSKGGALDQIIIQDASLRQSLNFGKGDVMYVDPVALAGFNKSVMQSGVNSTQRIVLSGSAQDAVGADLRRQFVSGGTIALEDSQFLRAKARPYRPAIGAPIAPASVTPVASAGSSAIPAGTYVYFVTAWGERGEGVGKASAPVVVASGQEVEVTIDVSNIGSAITHVEVYRGATAQSAKSIGLAKYDGSGSVVFLDLGNAIEGGTTGYLLQKDTWEFHELAPYSRLKLAVTDLSVPEAHFSFRCLAGYMPRKNVLVGNLK